MDDKHTPSSVGDIEAEVPVSVPETIAPLSVRIDRNSIDHTHTAIHHHHPEPLLQHSHLSHGVPASMETIQPSALTVDSAEEAPPGSVRLGPSEFAITLPMDSRVKDDYEKVLTGAASSMREFFLSFSPTSQVSETEVSLNSIYYVVFILTLDYSEHNCCRRCMKSLHVSTMFRLIQI